MKKLTLIAILFMSTIAMAAINQDIAVKTDEIGDSENKNVELKVYATVDDNTPRIVKVHKIESESNAAPTISTSAYNVTVNNEGEEPTIKVISKIDIETVDENRGWLGVALGEVSSAASRENDLESEGVVVLNVVKDSPAEIAGLQENDIIVSINGESIDEGVPGLADVIRDLGPGAEITISVIRDGETLNLNATLDKPRQEFQWQHVPSFNFTDHIRLNPKLGKISPQGKLQFYSIDDLDDLKGLPGIASSSIAQTGVTAMYSTDDGESRFEIVTIQDDKQISVTKEKDGSITVVRTDENGEEEQSEYANMDELEAGDAEAFELLSQTQSNVIIIGDGENRNLDFDFDFEVDNLLSDKLNKTIEIRLKDAEIQLGKYAERMDEIHETIEKAMEGISLDKLTMSDLPNMSELTAITQKINDMGTVIQTFKVNPDGQLELTIRKGDTEVIKIYSDEEDLKNRNPEAYEKYRDVLDSEK